MAHHGDGNPYEGMSPEMAKKIERLKGEASRVFMGATGEFPEGHLTKQDEGELAFGIAGRDGKVILNFGKPVAWIGMTPQQAVQMAESLLAHARRQSSDVLTMKLGG